MCPIKGMIRCTKHSAKPECVELTNSTKGKFLDAQKHYSSLKYNKTVSKFDWRPAKTQGDL